MDWQPIETAPKDGTYVLLYFPSKHGELPFLTGQWREDDFDDEDRGAWWGPYSDLLECALTGFGSTSNRRPTHWMPLPEPPPSRAWEGCYVENWGPPAWPPRDNG